MSRLDDTWVVVVLTPDEVEYVTEFFSLHTDQPLNREEEIKAKLFAALPETKEES